MSGFQQQLGWKIISWQFLLALFSSIALLPVFGLVVAYSAFAGGLISVAGNAIFAIRLFDDRGSWQAGHLAAALYRGLIAKYFLTMALFFMAVAVIEPINIPALFAVYLLVQVSPALIAGVQKA
ncbi:MAG: ATP synthase subunit I [Gammaproteobacteria bacterium]|nr:ATP synthase subunit I [Gammaproteobacteria bacterium]